MTTVIQILRDARATGETVAAIDYMIELGYNRERGERACRPYAGPSLATRYRWASEAAKAAAADLDAAWEGHVHDDGDESQCDCANVDGAIEHAQAAYDRAEIAVEAAREAWLESDEKREWYFGGESVDGGRERQHWHSPSEVEGKLSAWTEGGDWDTSSGMIRVRDYAWAIDPVTDEPIDETEVRVLVTIEPEEPDCEDAEHDWRSPHCVVGGLRENPGVRGNGGGVIIREVCAHCGRYRVTDTWAQDSQTGEQGLTSVAYEDADDDSLEWIASRRRVEAL